MRRSVTLVVLLLTGCAGAPFVPIFDGETLEGWHALPGGEWKIEDGAIIGTSLASEKRHGLLVTDRQFNDFVAQAEFKVIKGDSGFYFRIEETGGRVAVAGFQVEIDNVEPGGLYETAGRQWVIKKKPEEVAEYYRPKEWNSLLLVTQGPDVFVFVNGHSTAVLRNDSGRRSGHIALQLHGSQAMHVEYRGLTVKELGAGDDPWPGLAVEKPLE